MTKILTFATTADGLPLSMSPVQAQSAAGRRKRGPSNEGSMDRAGTPFTRGRRMQERLLTVRETADALRVSAGTLYALCARKEIRHERVGMGRGKILLPESAIEEFRQARTTATRAGARVDTPPPVRPPVTLKHLRFRDGG